MPPTIQSPQQQLSTNQFRIDLVLDKGEEVSKFLESNFISYFISFEKGTETNKPHWQGWVNYVCKENTFRKKCLDFAKTFNLSGKADKKQYCFGLIKDLEGYYSYIIKNKTKTVYKEYTNIESITLEALRDSLPEFIPREEFIKKLKDKKLLPFDIAFKEIEAKCLVPNLSLEKIIDYKRIPLILKKNLGKTIDKFIWLRLLGGITVKLEQKYPHKDNKRFDNLLDKWVKDDFEFDQVFNTLN